MLLIIIQARIGSKRLPGKVLMRFLNKPVLQILIEKLKKIRVKKLIVVATSRRKEDDQIIKACKNLKINYFRGDLKNVAKRFYQIVLKYNKCEYFGRLSADSPLIDLRIINKIIKLRNKNYHIVTNVFPRTYPKGQSFELIKAKFFLEKFRYLKTNQDKKLYKINNVKILNIKSKLNFSNYSLALDTLDDYMFYKFLFKNYKDESFILNFKQLIDIKKHYERKN